MANTVPGSGLVVLDCLRILNNNNSDNNGHISYYNDSTGTGSQTNAQLLGINKYGCGQYMMWEEKGMRIGLRSVTNGGIGDLHFTAGSDSAKMIIRCGGCIDVQSGGVLNIYRSDNTRALQLYTTVNETVIDSWQASSEPLHIRSMGTGGRIHFFTCATERMRISAAGNVGIGSTSPNILGFTGTMLTLNGTGNYQGLEIAACGTARMTMLANIEGTFGYISTRQAGMSLVFEAGAAQERMRITCCGNVGIGTSSPNAMLQVAGNFTLSGGTRCILGDGGDLLIDTENVSGRNIILQSNSGQKVGVGTISPSYRLHVNGTFYAAGSSQDYKQSICNYNTDSCMFMKLKPVTYQYKDEWCHLGKELKSETQIGLIAEDVAEVYPELAILVNEDDQKIVRNVDYEKLSIVLLSEVQKLRKELDELKTK